MDPAMNSDNRSFPWDNLTRPDQGKVRLLRAFFDGVKTKHDFYFAKDWRDSLLLIYRLPENCKVSFDLPMDGVAVSRKVTEFQDSAVLELLNNKDIDVFFALCADLCRYTDRFDEAKAPAAFINRLKYLQHFYKRKGAVMSVAEQVGLIAELLVLQKVFLKRFNPSTAINIWCGIEDKSQDFSCSEYRLEVKSIIDHNKNSVIISSEDQLDGGELPLYLTIVRLERSSPDFPESVSLYSLIKAIESQLTTDANALDSFREKMLCKFQSIEYETDLLFKHYNQLFFSLSDISYYSVEDGFPRIIKENLPNGIHNISYTVNLDECSDFKVDEDQIFAQ